MHPTLRSAEPRERVEISHDDPGWRARVVGLLDAGPGYAVVRDVPLGVDLDHAKRSVFAIGRALGSPMWQDDMGTVVWIVHNAGRRLYSDAREMMNPDSVKSSTTNEPLPFHCDGAVRWLGQQIDTVLLLAYKTTVGGANRLVDAERVYGALQAEDPAAALRLVQPVPFGRKTGMLPGQAPVTYQPVFSWEPNGFRARINSQRVRATLRSLACVDVELERALDVLDSVLERDELSVRVHLDPGECLVINDRRVAHAREPFDQDAERVLLRMWLHRPPVNRQDVSWPVELD
jgi:alpha-ketoglutarate-dependent taurine dioxygenase